MDLSASDFLIQELSAVNINDKGVSIGEGSKINLQSGAIQKAFMGIAAKDGSELALQNFSIDQCEFGLTVFSKKPYFNLCKVEATQLNISPNIPHPFALEEKQKLYLNQQALTPTHEWGQLRLMFYPTQ